MDFKQIQELIKIINKSNIGELSIEENEFKITIKQKEEKIESKYLAPPQLGPTFIQQPSVIPASPVVQQKTDEPTLTKTENLLTIKSPMVGTFYRKSSPDKPSFVEVGDEISPGKIVCIIEAMKLFNEIESEMSGKIVKILLENASPVEYDQPLFLVDPA